MDWPGEIGMTNAVPRNAVPRVYRPEGPQVMEMGGVQRQGPGAGPGMFVPNAGAIVPDEVTVHIVPDEENERLVEQRDEAVADAQRLFALAVDMLEQAQMVDRPAFEEVLASFEQKYATVSPIEQEMADLEAEHKAERRATTAGE